MRSLRYILGGRAHTVDDCLDLARGQPPTKVTLTVETREFMGDIRIVRQFVASYRWEFADYDVCCKEAYGWVAVPAGEQEQSSAIAAANARLRRRLEEIQRYGITVSRQGGDMRTANICVEGGN